MKYGRKIAPVERQRSQDCKRPQEEQEEQYVEAVWRIVVQAGAWQVDVARQWTLRLFDLLARISCSLAGGLYDAPDGHGCFAGQHIFDAVR